MPISAEAHAERRRAKAPLFPQAPRSQPARLQVGPAGGQLVAS